MTDTKIVIDRPSVVDGAVKMQLVKTHTWVSAQAMRHKLDESISTEPFGQPIIINIPVEGVKEGDELAPEQVAQILEVQLSILIPCARVFMQKAGDDFIEREDNF